MALSSLPHYYLLLDALPSQGAEPIYLHVIRPLVKPHTATLDGLLDLICMVGDILFLLSTFPLRLALSSWPSLSSYNDEGLDSENDLRDPSPCGNTREHEALFIQDNSALQSTAHQRPPFPRPQYNARRVHVQVKRGLRATTQSTRGTVRTRRQALEEGMNQQVEIDTTDPSRTGQIHTPPSQSQHQIWYPPPSSYNDTAGDEGIPIDQASLASPSSVVCGPSNTQRDASPESEEAVLDHEQVDEWRKYPQFPSAYPSTPLVTSSRLPLSLDIVSPAPRRPSNTIRFPPIPEDSQRQDFGRSLLPPREPLNPGLLGGANDEDNGILGVQHNLSPEDPSMAIDDDESETDEDDAEHDDDFDITLRTPRPPSGASRSRFHTRSNERASIASSSGSSLPSQSTALTTIDNGSSLRTRTTSESSSLSMSISDSSSLLGRKRPLPQNNPMNVLGRTRALDGPPVNKTSSGRTVIKPKPHRNISSGRISVSQQQTLTETSASESVDENLEDSTGASDSDEDSICEPKPPQTKRRRVVVHHTRETAVYSTRTPRPGTRRAYGVSASPSRTRRAKSFEVRSILPRTSSRLRSGPATGVVAPPTKLSQAGLSSASNSASSRRASERNTTRKK